MESLVEDERLRGVVARSSAVTKTPKAISYKRCKTQKSLTGGRDGIMADSRRFWVVFKKVLQVESACSSTVWVGFVQFPPLLGGSVGVSVGMVRSVQGAKMDASTTPTRVNTGKGKNPILKRFVNESPLP